MKLPWQQSRDFLLFLSCCLHTQGPSHQRDLHLWLSLWRGRLIPWCQSGVAVISSKSFAWILMVYWTRDYSSALWICSINKRQWESPPTVCTGQHSPHVQVIISVNANERRRKWIRKTCPSCYRDWSFLPFRLINMLICDCHCVFFIHVMASNVALSLYNAYSCWPISDWTSFKLLHLPVWLSSNYKAFLFKSWRG